MRLSKKVILHSRSFTCRQTWRMARAVRPQRLKRKMMRKGMGRECLFQSVSMSACTVYIWLHTLYLYLILVLSFIAGLSKAETQALTNYGSGEDENEEEEIEEFEAGPVDVQTSLQASADGQMEQEVTATVSHKERLFFLINNCGLFLVWPVLCVLLQGTTATEAQETKTEQRTSENDDGENFLAN